MNNSFPTNSKMVGEIVFFLFFAYLSLGINELREHLVSCEPALTLHHHHTRGRVMCLTLSSAPHLQSHQKHGKERKSDASAITAANYLTQSSTPPQPQQSHHKHGKERKSYATAITYSSLSYTVRATYLLPTHLYSHIK